MLIAAGSREASSLAALSNSVCASGTCQGRTRLPSRCRAPPLAGSMASQRSATWAAFQSLRPSATAPPPDRKGARFAVVVGGKVLGGGRRVRLVEMKGSVGRSAFDQGHVAEEDVHLGIPVLASPHARGPDGSGHPDCPEMPASRTRPAPGGAPDALDRLHELFRHASNSPFSNAFAARWNSTTRRVASSTSAADVAPCVRAGGTWNSAEA